MLKKTNWSWLRIFKTVPLTLAISTGSFSVFRDAMFLNGNAPEPHTAFWAWLRTCFIMSFAAVWFQQHRRITVLETKMRTGVVIEGLERSVWPFERHNHTGAQYHFNIRNLSASDSLQNVRAEIIEIYPTPTYPPLPLPMKVKNDEYDTREFEINPLSIRQIDLVTGPTADPRSHQSMIIVHTVTKELSTVESPASRYRITVQVGARNTTPVTGIFEAWVEDGELRCVQL
jgi:hypothetical protein